MSLLAFLTPTHIGTNGEGMLKLIMKKLFRQRVEEDVQLPPNNVTTTPLQAICPKVSTLVLPQAPEKTEVRVQQKQQPRRRFPNGIVCRRITPRGDRKVESTSKTITPPQMVRSKAPEKTEVRAQQKQQPPCRFPNGIVCRRITPRDDRKVESTSKTITPPQVVRSKASVQQKQQPRRRFPDGIVCRQITSGGDRKVESISKTTTTEEQKKHNEKEMHVLFADFRTHFGRGIAQSDTVREAYNEALAVLLLQVDDRLEGEQEEKDRCKSEFKLNTQRMLVQLEYYTKRVPKMRREVDWDMFGG